MSILSILGKFPEDSKMVRFIAEIMKGDDEYKIYDWHQKLRIHLGLHHKDVLEDYEKEYHDFMYVRDDNAKKWFRNGKLHRDDRDAEGRTLPALIHVNYQEWYIDGERHREDRDAEGKLLPARIYNKSNEQTWYWRGKIHRDERDADGQTLPADIDQFGRKRWVRHGNLHRDDRDAEGKTLPASIWTNGKKFWYRNGKNHRYEYDENGKLLPAIIWEDGTKHYFYNGQGYTSSESLQRYIDQTINKKFSDVSDVIIELENGSKITLKSAKALCFMTSS